MLFPVGTIAELSSDDGRRRPISFYDAMNRDISAHYDDKTIVVGDLDDLFCYFLTYYIQWPIYAARFKTADPFKPFFELWRRGVAWRFTTQKVVEVFTP